ncbi:MAG: ATP-binding protein [Lachnospiraceae bacterium]|nr:ATP-binding protein [Lachnospiraceae bacterium]
MIKERNNNPYTLVFGKQPAQTISRFVEMEEVLSSFYNEPPNQQIYMITGVRGCGKTVFMTEIAAELKTNEDWEVIEISTARNMMKSLAESLSKENRFTKLIKGGLGVSLAGFGIQLGAESDNSSPDIVIRQMLDVLKKHNKKLLICVDEVVSNEYVREFASVFQILLREDYPIFLLMTGLYENISNLRNEKNLTFLYRAPEVRLKVLNLSAIADNYVRNINVSEKAAEEMAALTKGFSFAFQVLGYFTYRHDGDYKAAIPEYRQFLEDYVYEKLWSELSFCDKKLLYAAAKSKSKKAKDIKIELGWENNQYTPYRDRLIKKMLINGDDYGYVKITLPLFEDYILRKYQME